MDTTRNSVDGNTSANEQRALRRLCEIVYQPTDARRDALMAEDWSRVPRVQQAFDDLELPVAPTALAEVTELLIRKAIQDLEPHFPVQPGSITPVEVVRWHILDRQPWPSIEAMLQEEGRPFSRGTLIRRQHEFLPYLHGWAAGEPREARQPVVAEAPRIELAPARSPRKIWIPVALTLAGVLIWITLAGGLTTPDQTNEQQRRIVPLHLVGRTIPGFRVGQALPGPWPDLNLPELDPQSVVQSKAILFEQEAGEPRLLIGMERVDELAVRFCYFDPVTESVVAEFDFLPPPQQRLTHSGVGPEVLNTSYQVASFYHAGLGGDLGDYAVAVLQQKYSPTFVIFINLLQPEVDGYYVTPGHLGSGSVVDAGRDGRWELILAGQDNAVNRAEVVLLRPGPWIGAASTVAWNTSHQEAAIARILLPRLPEVLDAMAAPRFAAAFESPHSFDPGQRLFDIAVGASGNTVYHIRLGTDLRPDPTLPVLYWDNDLSTHKRFDLALPPIESWQDDYEYIEGTDQPTQNEGQS